VNHYVSQMQERQQTAQAEADRVQALRQARTTTSDTLAAQTEGR